MIFFFFEKVKEQNAGNDRAKHRREARHIDVVGNLSINSFQGTYMTQHVTTPRQAYSYSALTTLLHKAQKYQKLQRHIHW